MEEAKGSLQIDAVSHAVSFATVTASPPDFPAVLLLAVAPAPVLAMETAPAVPKATDVVVSVAPATGCSFANSGFRYGALVSSAPCRRFIGFTSPAVEVLSILDLRRGLMLRLRETCVVKGCTCCVNGVAYHYSKVGLCYYRIYNEMDFFIFTGR